MSNEGDDSDESAPYVSGSSTSKGAALSIQEDVNALQAVVLEALTLRSMTDEELQEVTSLGASTERPRRVELCRKQLVCDSGLRRRGKARRAKPAVVWQRHKEDGCTCVHSAGTTGSPVRQSLDDLPALADAPTTQELQEAVANLRLLYAAGKFSTSLTKVALWLKRLSEVS